MPRVQGLGLKVSVVSLDLPPSPGGHSTTTNTFRQSWRFGFLQQHFSNLLRKKRRFNPVYPLCTHFFQVVLPQVHLLTKGCTPFPTRFCTWQPGFNISFSRSSQCLVQIWEVSPGNQWNHWNLLSCSVLLRFPYSPVCLYEDPILKRAKTNPAVWWLTNHHDVTFSQFHLPEMGGNIVKKQITWITKTDCRQKSRHQIHKREIQHNAKLKTCLIQQNYKIWKEQNKHKHRPKTKTNIKSIIYEYIYTFTHVNSKHVR